MKMVDRDGGPIVCREVIDAGIFRVIGKVLHVIRRGQIGGLLVFGDDLNGGIGELVESGVGSDSDDDANEQKAENSHGPLRQGNLALNTEAFNSGRGQSIRIRRLRFQRGDGSRSCHGTPHNELET